MHLAFVLLCAGLAAESCAPTKDSAIMQWRTLDAKPPLVIAHRGASGYRPEHTLAGYKLAIEQGADVIEPDLVFTKDGVLVVRHDRYLATTTDVADHPEFADRKRANDDAADAPREDWWVEDFTLEELNTLRALQPFPGRSKEYDGLYEIPTFEEVLALVEREAAKAGRRIGIYPETKHPAFFAAIGHDFEAPLLNALEGFDAGPVFIQSFEPEILKRLRGKTAAKLVQLVYEETPGAGPNIPLADIATYADGVGPSKDLILRPYEAREEVAFDNVSSLVTDAHRLGLFVHPWTFRNDVQNPNVIVLFTSACYFVQTEDSSTMKKICEQAQDYFGNKPSLESAEYRLFYTEGVDGVFTDFPDTAVGSRETIAAED